MVFTQSRGFVVGESFGLSYRRLRSRVLVCHAADTASLATWFLFGKLLGVATFVDFGEKRCRKNLPLADADQSLMNDPWPYSDPPNVMAMTLQQIMDGSAPILLVCRDDDDGTWQFLDGNAVSMADALLVCLKNVVSLDPSVAELADMPIGWQAVRTSGDAPWQREPAA